MLHIHEWQRNVIKDYRKLEVNKFYDRVLLPDGCACFAVGGQAANANRDPRQLLKAAVEVQNACMRTVLDAN